ncbi:hypothetical protein [Caldalkalibacillus mannanilyticus]|uniref:hypothetical protein n=1 Tax=Caldalkalibacillus mannanilyticus TaxID=1418 RepID=UPI00131F341F|nr:hypothetical protein [Caldalkalibacillus mannanilyticus]
MCKKAIFSLLLLVLQLLTAQCIKGITETTFAPKELTTRAQSTVVLKRMLQYLQFID